MPNHRPRPSFVSILKKRKIGVSVSELMNSPMNQSIAMDFINVCRQHESVF